MSFLCRKFAVPLQDEIFEVQKGKVGYVCDGLEGEMEQGKAYTLPAGTVHTFWNLEPDHPFEMKVSSRIATVTSIHIEACIYGETDRGQHVKALTYLHSWKSFKDFNTICSSQVSLKGSLRQLLVPKSGH